jgi:hypothetical protein
MLEPKKAYVILRADLSLESTLNTTALLSMGLAKLEPELVGPPVFDACGAGYPGITRVPIIIMKAKNPDKLKASFEEMRAEGLAPVPFFEHSRSLHTYTEYEASMMKTSLRELDLSGFGVVGDSQELKKHLKRFSLWK